MDLYNTAVIEWESKKIDIMIWSEWWSLCKLWCEYWGVPLHLCLLLLVKSAVTPPTLCTSASVYPSVLRKVPVSCEKKRGEVARQPTQPAKKSAFCHTFHIQTWVWIHPSASTCLHSNIFHCQEKFNSNDLHVTCMIYVVRWKRSCN